MISLIDELINEVARLPFIGQRSARKIVISMLKNKGETADLIKVLQNAISNVKCCKVCGNFDSAEICSICADTNRNSSSICIVESVEDLWVVEKSNCFTGKYHVLNGLLSAIDEITPESLRIPQLVERCKSLGVTEVIMGLNLNVDSRITACYISDILQEHGIATSNLAAGIPVGGELSYLDSNTITLAFQGRK